MIDRFKVLSSNKLKLVACFCMLLDHVRFLFFPSSDLLAIIGRLAFPIFAFFIAEGCYYTKNRLKHLLVILLFGIVMQVATSVVCIYDVNIFIIFSISIVLIYIFDMLEDSIHNKKALLAILSTFLFVIIIVLVLEIDTNFEILKNNYGFYGVVAPMIIYVFKKKYPNNLYLRLIMMGLMIIAYSIFKQDYLLIRLSALLALPLLCLYDGTKGKHNLKYFFYLFYPLHMLILYVIFILINS